MKRILRMAFLCVFAAAAAAPGQIPPPAQPPNTPPQRDEIVLGAYNIATNGDSGTYDIVPNDPSATRREQENSAWNLTYKRIGTAYCLLPQLTRWKHVTITTKPQLNQVTTVTQTSISGRPPSQPPPPTPCNQSRVQTYPMDSTGTLIITAVTPLDAGPGTVHKRYRAVALASGSSLPEMMVQTDTVVTNLSGKTISSTTSQLQILTASIVIKRWDQATWTTPYSGNISVQNAYPTYTTPENNQWLTITATWNLQPN